VTKFTCLITPGRSGSTFLQVTFNRLYNVFAEESYYTITGKPEQCFSSIIGKTEAEKNTFIKSKIEYIEGLNCEHYMDSVSLICQDNNIERFIDNGYVPNVITLRRDPRMVARSFYELNWDPINPPMSSLDLNAPDAIKMTLDAPHPYQLCLLYCFEIERITRDYKGKLEAWGVKHYETSLRELIENDSFNRMMGYFGMPSIGYVYTDKINALDSDKVRKISPNQLTELEEEFTDNIKANNNCDESLLDMNQWKY
jgi:hypothetical protein